MAAQKFSAPSDMAAPRRHQSAPSLRKRPVVCRRRFSKSKNHEKRAEGCKEMGRKETKLKNPRVWYFLALAAAPRSVLLTKRGGGGKRGMPTPGSRRASVGGKLKTPRASRPTANLKAAAAPSSAPPVVAARRFAVNPFSP